MTPETIFIHVWNCHAYVAKYKRAEQGITFIIAANWKKLESEAAEFVETITLSGHYPCPLALANKAVFVEIASKEEIVKAVRDWTVWHLTPMTAILFGGERLHWATWGAIARDNQSEVAVGLATVGDEGEGDGQPGIIGIMVLPDYRRQGIGRALLAAVVEEARQRDLLPLRYDALTLSGLALAQAAGYSPAELEIRDFTLGGTIGWLELK